LSNLPPQLVSRAWNRRRRQHVHRPQQRVCGWIVPAHVPASPPPPKQGMPLPSVLHSMCPHRASILQFTKRLHYSETSPATEKTVGSLSAEKDRHGFFWQLHVRQCASTMHRSPRSPGHRVHCRFVYTERTVILASGRAICTMAATRLRVATASSRRRKGLSSRVVTSTAAAAGSFLPRSRMFLICL